MNQRTWLALVVCLLSCSGKKSARDTAEAVFTEVCNHVYTCCSTGEAEFYLGPYTSDETCVDRLVEAGRSSAGVTLGPGPWLPTVLSMPNLVLLDEAIAEGRVHVDGGALDACLEWLRGLTCNTEVPDPEPVCRAADLPLDSPCRVELIFRGQVPAGGRCSSPGTTLECADGLACHTFDPLGPLGVCGVPGEVDDFCFTNGECQLGLYCRQLDGTCQEPGLAGEECRYADADDPAPSEDTLLIACAAGLSCDPLTRLCVTPCQQGATCELDADCDQEQGLMCILSRCDLPRGLGLPCTTDAHCQPDYRCETDPLDPLNRVCSPLIANGQPCPFGGHTECASEFCHPFAGVCAAQVSPPGLCPTGLDMECRDAWCDTTFISCADSSECADSMICDTMIGRCEYFCVALLPAGADCLRQEQCSSGACVDNLCRTFPTPDGEVCTADVECASGFCGHDSPRVCEQLPLADGRPCTGATQCSSGVCFAGECTQGLSEGQSCADPLGAPCGRDLYCDDDVEPAECAQLHDAGGICEGDFQCRGECTLAWSRQMCDPTPAAGTAICDGG